MPGMAERTDRAEIAVPEMPKGVGMTRVPGMAGMTGMAGKSDRIPDRHSSIHGQIGVLADGACGSHAPRDGAMHKTSAGAHPHDNGAMHIESARESNRIAD